MSVERADHSDVLNLPLRALLERLLDHGRENAETDPWIDAATCPAGWRHVLDAAKRGELEASRIGRRVLVRRSALDTWIASQRIEPRAPDSTKAQPPSGVAHLLEQNGYRRTGSSA